MNFNLQDLILILPMLILSFGVVAILILDTFIKTSWNRALFTSSFLIMALVACAYVAPGYAVGQRAFFGAVYVDSFALLLNVLIISGSIIAIMFAAKQVNENNSSGIESPGEFYALLLVASIGAIIFATAAETFTLFIGLETMSIALYCLCGSAIKIRSSSESALKYFLLGSFASAFMLYGIALIYGLTGSTEIELIRQAVASNQLANYGLYYFAIGFLLVGFAFKVALVPFQFWAPDVYQGAPTSITAYMSCVVKASSVAAMLRVMWTAFSVPQISPAWAAAIWVIALFTMTFGNLVALRQNSLKRMLAYSSISHAGYILVAFLSPGVESGAAILYYLVAYTVMTLGAFGVVMIVTDKHVTTNHPDDISRFNGLALANPGLALVMAIFMLSLAGLPPGFAGMLGKFYLFNAAIKANYIGLAIVGVINSAISCYYYLRVLVAIYFKESTEKADFQTSYGRQAALAICAVATIAIGLFPNRLHAIAEWAMAAITL